MIKKSRIMMVGAVSLVTLCACNPSGHPKESKIAKPTVAATVNGAAISENQVALLLKQRHQQPETPEMRKEIIDQLSMQVILSQEAVKKGLNKASEVSDQLELTQQSILANAFVQDYLKSNPISEEALKAEYEKIKLKMSVSEYQARHILVANEAEANDIIAKLKKNPKSFEALAKAKSLDTGSKAKGGDLGWFDPQNMVPEFGQAIIKLNKGEFSMEPVKSQFGYHVILLEDNRPKSAPPLDQVKQALQQQLQQQSVKKLIDDLKSKAKIDIPKPAELAPAKESKSAEPAKENKNAEAAK